MEESLKYLKKTILENEITNLEKKKLELLRTQIKNYINENRLDEINEIDVSKFKFLNNLFEKNNNDEKKLLM